MATLVKISSSANFTSDELKKLDRAAFVMQAVLNSPAFKDAILNFSWKEVYSTGHLWWKKSFSVVHNDFRMNNGKSNQDIYDIILSGAEVLNPVADQVINLNLDIADGHTGVLGWTTPGSKWQWLARWFFSQANDYDLAGNFMHEWMHKAGFDHEFNRVPNREYTVPYAVGYIMQRLAKDFCNCFS